MSTKSDAQIIAAMTRAGVPRSCWNVSTQDTGRMEYRSFAQEIVDKSLHRDQPRTAYVRMKSKAGYLDIEMLSKEMVLANIPTRYTTFHKLARDLRMQEALADNEHPLTEVYARGAIVLPEVPIEKDVADADRSAYRETIEYLIGHAYEGGILVVGGERRLSKRLESGYPPLFERLLVETSKVFEGN